MNKKLIIGASSLVLLISGTAVAIHSESLASHNSEVQAIPDSSLPNSTADPSSQSSADPASVNPDGSTSSSSTATSGTPANTNPVSAPSNSTPADTTPANPAPVQQAPVPQITSRSMYYEDTGTRYNQHCTWTYDNGDTVDKIIGYYNHGSAKIQYDCPDSP